MHDLFTRLLISSPNGGGLFLVNDNQVFKLDSFDTTGISWTSEVFLRGHQPGSVWICGDRMVDVCNESVPFNDIHDVLCFDDSIYLVGTTKNEIVKLDRSGSEVQRWVFPGEDDSRHVNCLGIWNNRIVFSAFGDFREARAYKGRTSGAGYVRDLLSGERLIVGLSQPHSLVSVDGNLLVANSEEMEIREYEPSGDLIRAKKLDGYTRGICVSGRVVYVGLSRSRNIEDCSVNTATLLALDLESWKELGRISLPTNEIYSVLSIDDAHKLVGVIANAVSHSSLRRDGQLAQLRAAVDAQQQTLAERDVELNGLTQAVAERDTRLAELDKVVTDLEDGIATVLRAMSDSEEEIHHLVRILHGLEGEQGPYTGLVQMLIERNHQIAGLRESVRERDERAAALAQQVAERDGRLAQLQAAVEAQQQTLAERDGQLNSLTQALSERDAHLAATARQLHALQESLQEAQKRIQAMERSRSWRMTAPYRWIGTALRFVSNYIGRKTPFSRPVVALLLLPAAFVFYGGIFRFFGAWRRDKGVFAKVIAGQALIRERLLSRSRLVRRFVFACFSLAVRIQRAGSVKRSLGSFFRIIRTEGLGGIRGRMITTAPGMTAAPVPVGEGRPAELPVLAKEVARRILVADYRVPRPDVSAGERATVGILQDLCALGYEVVFLPNDMVPSPRYEAGLRAIGVQLVTRESGFDYSTQYLEKHGSEFGAFYLIRVDVAEALLPIARKVAPDARIIFHAPDLYFLREMREAVLRNDPAARERAMQTRDRELAMMSRSDRVVVVSPAEVPVLREVLPDTPISVFPVLYAPVVENPRPYVKRKNIFFLGGFGHPPNVNAVQWFAAEVWPHVHKALPKVEFHIIGAEAPDSVLALGKLPGTKVVGFVPELEPVLETLRVGVAPLQYGAGIKGKVATAMGAGIPCVCTEIAAEGMGIKNDVHALVENDPVRFAQAIVTLYQDEKTWSRLARNGQALVQDKYGDAANRASLLKVLDQAQALPISLFVDYCQAAKPVAVPNPGAEAEVDVSIIIPVYNKWNLTRACLTSVVQTSVGSGVTYEVILADDGSTDETIRAAEMFPGLRIVKTPKNLGFLRNCNNAAKHARGRHILLLNNDTVVLPGWLESLYRTMEQDPSIAIVGSKLLYPDEHIQEAGGGLLSNADGVSVGRWLWVGERNFPVRRREPIFNIRRETDYISGASILVRKSFWDSVGGFDERYKNAYCEDSDLAMVARSKGLRVVYEPESEVIHFEHQTYSGQMSTDHARLQEQNKAELIAKWGDVFQRDHLPPGSKWYQVAAHGERTAPMAMQARRKQGSLNILYFSPFPSHPSNHGNQATIQQFARRFQSMGHKVHFALLQSSMYSPEHEQAMRNAWDTFDILPNSHPLGANGQPIPFDGWYEEGLGERIRLLCAKYDIDIVFCSYIFQSKMLEYVPDYILKVIDTHDKMGDRYEMLRKNGQPLEFFSCTPEEEGAYLRRADVVVARREEEARYFDSVTGRQTAIVVPHVEEPHFLDRSFDSLKNVGIVASANRINLAIVRECLEAIDRKLAGNACPFTVHVAGQVKDMAEALPASESAIFKRPWVRMHGFVPEIAQFYGDMDVVVSPVTMGTGINVKTVQAMAFGMPLLTTVCGSKGIETDDPMHCHTSLDALADSLLSLTNRQDELVSLAALSRERYMSFYESCLNAMRQLFAHPKLTWPIAEEKKFDPGVLDYQKYVWQRLMQMAGIGSLKGKKIMEVGGNGNMAVAKTFYDWSGEKVAVVTPDPELHPDALDPKKMELIMRPAEDSELLDDSFDLVYGCAVLEHIQKYEKFFHECFRLVKPGGHVLLHGGPHWNCRVGHHLFVVKHDMDYRFNQNNPVPDFGHIYLTEKEMKAELAERGIPESHIESIIWQIYHDGMLNRASIEDILNAFQSLPWGDVQIQKEGAQPEADILARIQSRLDVNKDIIFAESLYIAAQKPPAPTLVAQRLPLPLNPVFMEDGTGLPSPQIHNQRSHAESEAAGDLVTSRNTHVVGTLSAFCYLCGPAELSFSTQHGWQDTSTGQYVINWREHLICPRCGLNNRMRATVHFLDTYCSIAKEAHVYITEQNTRLFRVLQSSFYPNIVGSEFLGNACSLGKTHNGMRNEDMTRLTFADNTLAGVFSFDVLEHIPDYRKALAEVYRCLAPGGEFVFSAPFDRGSKNTLVRAEVTADGSIRHLLPPEYHGDPVNPNEGILCFQHFGWDLLSVLRETGFEDVKAVDYWSRDYGYFGNCLLFTARKSGGLH